MSVRYSAVEGGYESAVDDDDDDDKDTEKFGLLAKNLSTISEQLALLSARVAVLDQKIDLRTSPTKSTLNNGMLNSPRSTGHRRRSSLQDERRKEIASFSLTSSPLRDCRSIALAPSTTAAINSTAAAVAAAKTSSLSSFFEEKKNDRRQSPSPPPASTPRLFDRFSFGVWKKSASTSLSASPVSSVGSGGGGGRNSESPVSPRSVDINGMPLVYTNLLGCGATARVYEANVGGLVVAAKVYHQHFFSTSKRNDYAQVVDKECQRLTKNINILCALQSHPHILTTISWRIEQHRLIVLNERVHCTLADMLDAQRNSEPSVPNRIASILRVQTHVALALLFLQRPGFTSSVGVTVSGIMHRDVKAENIFCKHVLPQIDWSGTGQCATSSSSSSSRSACFFAENSKTCINWHHYDFMLGDFDEAHVIYKESADSAAIDWIPADSPFINSSTATTAKDEFGGTNADVCCKSEPSLSKLVKETLSTTNATAGTSLGGSSNTLQSLIDSPRCATSSRSPKTIGLGKMVERLDLCVGTLEYMAPEMANDRSVTYDASVDVWSLGMLIYEMMTLTPPHGALQSILAKPGGAAASFSRFQIHEIVASGQKPEIPTAISDDLRWEKVLRVYNVCTQLDPRKRATPAEIVELCGGN